LGEGCDNVAAYKGREMREEGSYTVAADKGKREEIRIYI